MSEGWRALIRDPDRPDPGALLARIKAEEAPATGSLRIYLGAAPGVGKTYAKLLEAHRRKERGTDVVIGIVVAHGRPHTIEQIGDLEVVPPREVPYKGVTVQEMDTDAVIVRHPEVVLLDELAHTNVPGSRHESGNPTALRDLALRATAKGVEDTLSQYMRDAGGDPAAPVAVADRILVAVDHRPIGRALIRRGWRIASALKAELMATYVEPERGPRAAQTVEDERQLPACGSAGPDCNLG